MYTNQSKDICNGVHVFDKIEGREFSKVSQNVKVFKIWFSKRFSKY